MRTLYYTVVWTFFFIFTLSSIQAQSLRLGVDEYERINIRLPQSVQLSLEKLQDSNDFEPLANFKERTRFRRLGQPIGRLKLIMEGQSRLYTNVCTAFIISKDYIMTNYHCIPGLEGRVKEAKVEMEYLTKENTSTVRSFRVETSTVEESARLDYSIVQVYGDPSQEYGTVEFSQTPSEGNDAVFIIHHPAGDPKTLSRKDCFLTNVTQTELAHSCDTLGGSSGSPIFSNESFQVVGLHNAGAEDSNYGKSMAALINNSLILQKTFFSPPTPKGFSYRETEDEVILEWEPVPIADSYYIERQGNVYYETRGNSIRLSDLKLGTNNFRVRSINQAGESPWSAVLKVEIKPSFINICRPPTPAQKKTLEVLAKQVNQTYSPNLCEIFFQELNQVTSLSLGNTQISDISALEGLTRLTSLSLGNTQISDISSLEGLTRLTFLNLYNTQISDIRALKGLTQLSYLSLENTQISDISALKGLIQLSSLSLNNTQISDISALKGLTQLSYLSLENTQISDISALRELTQLSYLSLNNTQISDISTLKGLTQLTFLYLGNIQISDISALKGLTQLTHFDLYNTQISDISALRELTQLTSLSLAYTQISDISALRELTQLSYLYLNHTQISDISALRKLTQLSSLSLAYTQISDISALRKLTQLFSLYLNHTQISDISVLGGLTQLDYLELIGIDLKPCSPKSLEELQKGISCL